MVPATVEEAQRQGYSIHGVYQEEIAKLRLHKLQKDRYKVVIAAVNGNNQPVRKGTKAVWVKR